MTAIAIDGLIFTFEAGWRIAKYDDWAFYRRQFARMWSGIKALDLLAADPTGAAWLVEVKDYRRHVRTKPSDLAVEVAKKVFDTLAAMLPAAVNANDANEKALAQDILRATRLRVVLHLEQPAKQSALRPRAIDPAQVMQELRRLLRAIDPHPKVTEIARLESVPWACAST